MPRTRPPYPLEFRREAVELLRSGVPLKQVAAELGVSESRRCATGAARATSTPGAPRV
jgi:transposase-like protein